MGYGVIGNTGDSGSSVLGSSPGTPALARGLAPQAIRRKTRRSVRFLSVARPLTSGQASVTAPLCSGLARRPLKAVARVRIPSGLQRSKARSPSDRAFASSMRWPRRSRGVNRGLGARGALRLLGQPPQRESTGSTMHRADDHRPHRLGSRSVGRQRLTSRSTSATPAIASRVAREVRGRAGEARRPAPARPRRSGPRRPPGAVRLRRAHPRSATNFGPTSTLHRAVVARGPGSALRARPRAGRAATVGEPRAPSRIARTPAIPTPPCSTRARTRRTRSTCCGPYSARVRLVASPGMRSPSRR